MGLTALFQPENLSRVQLGDHEWWIWKDLEGYCYVTMFEGLFQYLSRYIEEIHKESG